MKIEEIKASLRTNAEKIDAYAKMPSLTEEQTKDWQSAIDAAESAQKTIETLERSAKLIDWAKAPAAPALPMNDEKPKPQDGNGGEAKGLGLTPALPIASSVKHFKSEKLRDVNGEMISLSSEEKAYRFGMWAIAVLGDPRKSFVQKCVKFCNDNGVEMKAHSEAINSGGGYLVPPEFGNDMIILREQFGVFRANAKIVPMASDTRSDPRRTGGLTAYFIGENTQITESQKGWDRVNLTAKKLAVLTKMSSELNEDSVVNLGDDLAGEISYAFANKEDLCGFLGDGTSTYGGIVGLTNAFLNLSGTIANIAGVTVAPNQTASNGYGAILLANFLAMQGNLPEYAAKMGNLKWYCHRNFYYNTMLSLALAAGGVTEAEILAAGAVEPRFLGYPVEFAQVMPKVFATSQIPCFFGNMPMTASLGDRRQVTIALSEHLNFDSDELAMRGTERFDINVHDVGNASATAGLRVTGPMVALITGAS